MDEFMNLLAEAIRAKADLDGVYTIEDFFSEMADGEEYRADMYLRVTADGYITFQEGSWSETSLSSISFADVKRIAYALGL